VPRRNGPLGGISLHFRTDRLPSRALFWGLSTGLTVTVLLLSLVLGGRTTPGRTTVAQGRADAPALPELPVHPARPTRAHQEPAKPDIGLYRGLGSWVDIYERSSWRNPERAIAGMHRHGVRTLYIETSNYVRRLPIKFAAKQARFIEAAHRAGMKIVAWYLPGFRDLRKDLWRSMKAINFRTPSGQSFDSFALDIESPQVANPYVRTTRLLRLSARIRAVVGPTYPLGAIIPSPKGMHDNPTYWPGFPYRALARDYDVFVPMAYFTWRVSGQTGAHAYTTSCIQLIRHEVGDRSVPIHIIGGISNDSTEAEARGFVHAVREQGVIGASYYAYHGTSRDLWRELERIPTNPVQRPPLPVRLGYPSALGNIPGEDRSHPRDVVFQTGPFGRRQLLRFQAYGVQRGEVTLRVNWHPVSILAPTTSGEWGQDLRALLPARWLQSSGPNFISFTAKGRAPRWGRWGIRTFGLSVR
jgi:hypothetical protein